MIKATEKKKGKKAQQAHRYISRDGRVNIKRKGLRAWHPQDWYYWLLTLNWFQLILAVGFLFAAINFAFGWLYWQRPESVVGADPARFWDYFFFSVQTFGTIGYGHMWPQGMYANSLATIESFLNFCSFGFFAGVLFSRLSKPSARVMFSQHAVIAPYEGAPALMFRIVNRRGNQIL